MAYTTENAMISESDKKVQVLFLFFVWFRSCEFNNVPTSSGIKSLIKFMVEELGWKRKRAAQEILNFFQEHQGWTDNQLIELWEFLRE